MNKQIQIELWPECRCFRCKFCNLVVSSEMRSDGTQCNPNIKLTSSQKNIFLKKAISFFDTINWSIYDTLLLRGGEIFNEYENIIVENYEIFIKKISNKILDNSIKKVFLVTSLKYPIKNSLLKLTFDLFEKFNVNIQDKILIGTSWDVKYRFNNESNTFWNNNINYLDNNNIPVHITSILTQAFIEEFNSNNKFIKNIMLRDFDFIAAQGKPELLHLDKFFPIRNDCIKFLIQLKESNEYHDIWYRLLHQNYRRAESIYFTEHDSLQIRDLETYKSVLKNDDTTILSCGHPKEYANYVDSEACFLCDLNNISRNY